MSAAHRWAFRVVRESRRSSARVGVVETAHGVVDTPGFVPVATQASLKHVDTVAADAHGCQLMFCNTYHLMLQPGAETVRELGGLHAFMRRRGPLITDSGGFQVFSMLAGSLELDHEVGLKGAGNKARPNLVVSVDEEGVTFRSYRDGALQRLTPEGSVRAQKELGADIIIPLDQLVAYNATPREMEEAVERSHRWELRSLAEHLRDQRGQAMYSVLHGGLDRALRQRSIDLLCAQPFDGHCVGGSLGRDRADLKALLEFVMPRLPRAKPVHVLGIADMESILNAVPLGADTFDSSYPTRAARHGMLLQGGESPWLKIEKAQFRLDKGPLAEGCDCYACTHYSRAYVHHLFRAQEPAGAYLATLHNVAVMNRNMARIRQQILHGEL
jgi:queuine tRNA-ribosyltransferase